MKKLKSQSFFRYFAIVFLLTYVLGSFINMISIPRYVPSYTPQATIAILKAQGKAYHSKFNPISFLQIFDKSTFENDLFNELSFAPKSFVLPYVSLNLSEINLVSTLPESNINYSYQYSYLSLCTFRI